MTVLTLLSFLCGTLFGFALAVTWWMCSDGG